MSSKDTEDRLNCTLARIEKFKYYDNTKGSTLVTDAISQVKVVSPGTDNQIFVADSTTTLGVKWFTVPPNVSIYFANIVCSILTYANSLSYSLFNPHTITNPVPILHTYVEIQFISSPQTILKFLVYPASNYTWPAGSNFTFDIGYLRNTAGTGPPDSFSSVTATTCTFVPIVGTTIVVDNSYSGTSTPAILTMTVPTLGPEYLCIRCNNATNTAGLIITANIVMKV